jgi:hypothetical protein
MLMWRIGVELVPQGDYSMYWTPDVRFGADEAHRR